VYGDSLDNAAIEAEMYQELNEIRTGQLTDAELDMYELDENLALPAWGSDAPLASAGRAHDRHMAVNGYFAHTTPGGKEFWEWYAEDMNRDDCGAMSQNIAKTPIYIEGRDHWETAMTDDPDETMARWILKQFMHSPPHRSALLEDRDGRLGVGVYITEPYVYTAQNMCSRP